MYDADDSIQNYRIDDTTHDTEIVFGESTWPAWRTANDQVLVDFRLYDAGDAGRTVLAFFPERCARMGVPDQIILRAAEHDGFVLFEH